MKSLFEKLYFILVFGEITIAWPGIFDRGAAMETGALHTGNPILLVLNTLVILGTLYYAWPRARLLRGMFLQLRWIYPLYAWMLLTVLWSVNRPVSFIAACRVVIYLLSAGVIALRYTTDELLTMLSRAFVASAVLSLAWQRLMPIAAAEEGPPGWTGIYPHKNVLGFCMMLAIVLLVAHGRRWSIGRLASVALCAALLFLSQSFTAILATAVTVLFVFSQGVAPRSKAMLFIGIGGVICILLILSDPLALILSLGGKSTSFTGRDAVWGFALAAISEQPLQGYGYGAFWLDVADSASQALNWSPPHAHNGFLQVTLDLGLVGLVMTLALLFGAWRRARRLRKQGSSRTGAWMLTMLVMGLVHNLTEADLVSVKVVWYLLVVGCMACLRAENESRHHAQHETLVAEEAELITA